MEIKFSRITSTEHKDYQNAQKLYHESFPQCEKRTEDKHIETLVDETFFAYTIYIRDEFAGILYFWQWDNFSYIEHLATRADLRGQNIGGRALDLWQEEQSGRILLLEIEPPTDEIKIRRKGFYSRHGFVSNPYYYLHPSYGIVKEPHELIIMSYPRPINQEQFDNFKNHSSDHIIKG